MSCIITASAPTNDHAQIRFCTLWVCKQQDYLCYAQPLNNCIFTTCEYSFETNPFCHTSTKYTSIKDLEILAELCLSQIFHLCTQKSVCPTNFGPFGEIGAYFPVQLRIHIFPTLKKIVIAENQCEKHKKKT